MERLYLFKTLKEVLYALKLFISKRTFQRFIHKYHLSWFVAQEHINIKQSNRDLRLTYALSRESWGIEDWMRMNWSDEWLLFLLYF